MFDTIDYLDVARTRYTDQFKDAPNFDYLMIVWMLGYQEIQNVFLNMLSMNDIDQAYGYQLDIIGDIVGQPRTLEDIDSTGFFGFALDSGALPFGSTSNGSGGLYISINQEDARGIIELPDNLYRTFIKAKIVSNNAGGTPEEVIQAARALFSVDTVELLEDNTESGLFSLYIGRPWNDEDLTAFPGLDETVIAKRLLPIPVGVRIDFVDVGISDTIQAVNAWVDASDQLYVLANQTLPANIPED